MRDRSGNKSDKELTAVDRRGNGDEVHGNHLQAVEHRRVIGEGVATDVLVDVETMALVDVVCGRGGSVSGRVDLRG